MAAHLEGQQIATKALSFGSLEVVDEPQLSQSQVSPVKPIS